MTFVIYDWGGLNTLLFEVINRDFGPRYDEMMLLLSRAGEPASFKFYLGALAICLFGELAQLKYKRQAVTPEQVRAVFAMLILMVMGYAAFGLVVGLLKSIVNVPRPFMIPEIRAAMHFAGPYPDPAEYQASFPSAHAATMAFIVTALWRRFNDPFAHGVGVVMVLLVAWSRVAVGMQFPADVVAGVIVGVGVALLIRNYVYRMMRLKP